MRVLSDSMLSESWSHAPDPRPAAPRSPAAGWITATEHDLLCALARNAGGVCSYDDLARFVWRRGGAG
jgi:hypothetical protein